MSQKRYHAPDARNLLKSVGYRTEILHIAFTVHTANCQRIIPATAYHISITFWLSNWNTSFALKLLFLHYY